MQCIRRLFCLQPKKSETKSALPQKLESSQIKLNQCNTVSQNKNPYIFKKTIQVSALFRNQESIVPEMQDRFVNRVADVISSVSSSQVSGTTVCQIKEYGEVRSSSDKEVMLNNFVNDN